MQSKDLRYPIGKFEPPRRSPPQCAPDGSKRSAAAPARFRDAVRGLSDEQLDTPYRPDGWTLRQVIHHVADSHMNSFIRFRLALTEDEPAVKPYDEAKWALIEDADAARRSLIAAHRKPAPPNGGDAYAACRLADLRANSATRSWAVSTSTRISAFTPGTAAIMRPTSPASATAWAGNSRTERPASASNAQGPATCHACIMTQRASGVFNHYE